MATPMMDAVRDYGQRARNERLRRRMTLASTAMRALERELAAAVMQMTRIERLRGPGDALPALFGVELVEEKDAPDSDRKPLRMPTLSDIVEEFFR